MPQLERESEIRSRVSDLKSSQTIKIIASFELHLFDAINVEASYPRPPAARIDCGHALRWVRFCNSSSTSSFFESLPTCVLGKAGRTSSSEIISCLPSRRLRNDFISSSVTPSAPGFSAMKAFGDCPR